MYDASETILGNEIHLKTVREWKSLHIPILWTSQRTKQNEEDNVSLYMQNTGSGEEETDSLRRYTWLVNGSQQHLEGEENSPPCPCLSQPDLADQIVY